MFCFGNIKKLSTIFKRVVQALFVSFFKFFFYCASKMDRPCTWHKFFEQLIEHACHTLADLVFFQFLTKTCGKKDLKSVSSCVVPTRIFGELLIFSHLGTLKKVKTRNQNKTKQKQKSQHRIETRLVGFSTWNKQAKWLTQDRLFFDLQYFILFCGIKT
jgi:hypothetical protein